MHFQKWCHSLKLLFAHTMANTGHSFYFAICFAAFEIIEPNSSYNIVCTSVNIVIVNVFVCTGISIFLKHAITKVEVYRLISNNWYLTIIGQFADNRYRPIIGELQMIGIGRFCSTIADFWHRLVMFNMLISI